MPHKLSPLEDKPLRNTTAIAPNLSLLTFGLWLALAPTESAVLAKGHIRAMEDSKPIHHLRGGKKTPPLKLAPVPM